MKGRFRLPPMPIAGHVMLLVIGVLIVAQGATLVLTLTFPPQPPPQHSLEDIAKAMRGQSIPTDEARPLMRQVVDEAPHAEGPGWLSAVGPRDRLAALLNTDPSNVVLMFYVPLPAGAQPMAARPPQDRPKNPPSQAAEPRIVAAAFLPIGLGNPALIRNRQPGAQTAPFLERDVSGLRPGGFNDSVGRDTWRRQASRLVDRTTGGGRTPPWAGGQTRLSPPMASRLSLPTTVGSGLPRPIGQTGDGAALQPGGVGMGRALAAAMVARRRNPAPTSGVMTSVGISTTLSPSPANPVATAPAPERTPSPVPQEPRTPPVSIAPAVASSEVPVAAPQPSTAPRSSASQVETADLVPAAEAAPLTPVRRGLFAPPPAGYIEGDFIAAQRVGDRWIVVRPKPEGFPTAWQSRVMLWFLLSFILVGPLGWLFARRLTAPLRSFADAAERLGRDPSAPATVQGGSAEIARAAAAFNLMQARLKRYVEDRTAMIGAISHDLRTPLTRMRFRLEAAPDKLKRGFETDMDQMEAMISSVLAFMRDQAEGGARERLDLRTLLDEAVKNAVAGGADVALEPGEPVEVQADAVALNRVFANLLDNAVKYGGRAVVRLDKDGGEAIATVRDFGPGLPDSELERVFKPFYRAPHAVAINASGMGLGLANSRSIILAHGGAIRLRSQDGLTAEIRLPAAA